MNLRLEVIKEALLGCLREFEELENQYEWFTAGALIKRIHSALKQIEELKHDQDSIRPR